MSTKALEEQVAALATISSAQLRGEWLRLYKVPAPDITADLLRRGVAWKIQEKAKGSFSPSTWRQIDRMCRESHSTGSSEPKPIVRIKAGTRLVRDWGGESHHITVLEDGYLYRDQPYRSLSRIAAVITGAKWSGPRFFGLVGGKGASHA